MRISLPKLPQLPNRPVFQGASWVPEAADQQAALKASGQTEADTYDIIIQVSTLITSVLDSVYDIPVKTIAYGIQAGIDGSKLSEQQGEAALKKLSGKRNPLFDKHAADDNVLSPVTNSYLKSRRWKKLGGSAFQALGTLTSLAAPPAGVNIPGSVYHGQAFMLTARHMVAMESIASQYKEARIVQDWCTLIRAMKTTKGATRFGQLAGSIIPHGSMPSSIAAAIIKTGVKLTTTGACFAAAAQLQWIAYNEQGFGGTSDPAERNTTVKPGSSIDAVLPTRRAINYSRPFPPAPPAPPPFKGGPGAGPASGIIWEVFTKRGATKIFGAYDVAAMIREPAGWMALGDKLMLI